MELAGERITETPVTSDLDRAQLLEVARDRRLGDREAERGEAFGQFLLAGERFAADQVGERAVALVSGVGHRMNMHQLA